MAMKQSSEIRAAWIKASPSLAHLLTRPNRGLRKARQAKATMSSKKVTEILTLVRFGIQSTTVLYGFGSEGVVNIRVVVDVDEGRTSTIELLERELEKLMLLVIWRS